MPPRSRPINIWNKTEITRICKNEIPKKIGELTKDDRTLIKSISVEKATVSSKKITPFKVTTQEP